MDDPRLVIAIILMGIFAGLTAYTIAVHLH